MLEALGIAPQEERCYEAVLRRPNSTAAELGRELRIPAASAARALKALSAKGLARREGQCYVGSRPDIAIEILVLSRREELERVRAAAGAYLERFRSTPPSGEAAHPVDAITGPNEAIVKRWEEVQRSAATEVLILDRPPYVRSPTSPNPIEL